MTCTVPGCARPARSRGFCSRHYTRWQRYGDPTASAPPTGYRESLRWLTEAVTLDVDDCILWPYRTSKGYGYLSYLGKRRQAHQVALMLAGRATPGPNEETRHWPCGEKLCVNPRHLIVGSRAENYADSIVHGTAARGERHGRAKLTEDDVRAIRASAERSVDLADRYGVTDAQLCSVRSRKYWRHVK